MLVIQTFSGDKIIRLEDRTLFIRSAGLNPSQDLSPVQCVITVSQFSLFITRLSSAHFCANRNEDKDWQPSTDCS